MDLLKRFLFGLGGCSSTIFLLVKGLVLPSALDVEFLTLSEDILFLSGRQLRQIWLKPGKYFATISLDAAFWHFLATRVDVPESLGGAVS